MEITIRKTSKGAWEVQQADASAEGLTYDEMLGLVAALTMPEVRPCIHWMKTDAQREAEREFDDQIHERFINP